MGLAERYTPRQRAALEALGYTLLSRRAPQGLGESQPGAAAMLPATVRIEEVGMPSPLLRGIAASAEGCGLPCRREGGALELLLGGPGPCWSFDGDALRSTPALKAQLWRAMRRARAGHRA